MESTLTLWPWLLAAGSLALAGGAVWRARQASAEAARLHGEINHLRLLLRKSSQDKLKASLGWNLAASTTMDRAQGAAGCCETVALTAREIGSRVRECAGGIEELWSMTAGAAETADRVSAVAEAQGEALKQVASESARMAAGLDGVNLGVGCASLLSETCLDLVRQGAARLDGAGTALTAGQEAVRKAGMVTAELSAATAQIVEVAAQITQLADQTNQLARNAGLEASWAGEAGCIFGGATQKIRTLAERSAAAAMAILEIAAHARAGIESLQSTAAMAGQEIHTGMQALGEAATGLECIVQVQEDTHRSLTVVEEAVLRLRSIGGQLARKAAEAASGTDEQTALAARSAATMARLRESLEAMTHRTAVTTSLLERLSTEAHENRVSALLILEEVIRWSGPVVDLFPEGSFPDASAVA